MVRKIRLSHKIPVPEKKETKYPLKRMEIGDSFLVEDQEERKKVRTMASRLGMKITSRNWKGKIRVWRIE